MMRLDDLLRCPVCGAPLAAEDSRLLACCGHGDGTKRHTFDLSASGYVNLLSPGRMRNRVAGDPKDMVRARREFLTAGYYAPLAARASALIQRCLPAKDGVVADCGCGEGYYTAQIAQSASAARVLGFDASKSAVDYAARDAKRMGAGGGTPQLFYITANLFSLPLRDSCISVIFNMFAPVADTEFRRILRRDGVLIVGAAGERHLWEMKEVLYDHVEPNAPRAEAPAGFIAEGVENVTYRLTLPDRQTIDRLFSMTPYCRRTSAAGRERLAQIASLETTVSVDFYIYKPKD